MQVRVWYAGHWRTPEAIERYRQQNRDHHRAAYQRDPLVGRLKRYIRRNDQLNQQDQEVLSGRPQAKA